MVAHRRAIFALRGHLAMSGDIFCRDWVEEEGNEGSSPLVVRDQICFDMLQCLASKIGQKSTSGSDKRPNTV